MSLILASILNPLLLRADQNSPFPVKVLLQEGLNEVNIAHKSEGVSIFIEDNGELILPIKTEVIKIIKTNSGDGLFLLKIRQNLGFVGALKLSNDDLIPVIAKSDLNVFLFTKDNLFFDVEIGPFESKKDALNVKKIISELIPTDDIEEFQSNLNALCIKIDEKIFLRSSFSPSEKPTKTLTLKLKNDLFSFENRTYSGIFELYKVNSKISVVNVLDIEDYLRGVVPSEMPSSWDYNALCAQAIASRTFAFSRLLSARKNGVFYDVCDTTHCQVYLGARTSPATDKAIKDTAGLILTYNHYPIEAVFHSSSGGQTENNENIWQGSLCPYLRGVSSPGEEISPHFTWYKAFEVSEFLKLLNSYLKKRELKELTSLDLIEVKERGISPRVKKVLIKDKKNEIILSGAEIQSIFSLKSTWFDFLIYKIKDEMPIPPIIKYYKEFLNNKNPEISLTYVYIYGRGWGHGVGMPQYGAYAMASKGATYREILFHYYQGTQLEKISDYELNSILAIRERTQSGFCKIYFEPKEAKVYKGESPVNVALKISSGANIYGISFKLTFNEKIIDIDLESIKEGNFLRADGKATIFLKTKTQNGVNIGIAREGKVGGVSGEGDLLYFDIKGANKGLTSIELTEVQISDSQLNPVSFDYTPLKIEVIERDKTPPKTVIVEYPDRFTNKKIVYFEWSGSDDVTETKNLFYSFRLNDEPWSQFSQETSRYFNLVYDGNYRFEVRARDEAGNIDPNPPFFEFALDGTPPFIELEDYPKKTTEKSLTLKGIVEIGSTLLVNGENITLDENGRFTYIAQLKIGENLFRFIAVDRASNSKVLDVVIMRETVAQTVIILTIGSKKALVNNVVLDLDVAPLIESDRTFVPLRFIAESFGAKLEWNASEKRIDIVLDHPLVKKKITLWIKRNVALVNGNEVIIDAPPFILPPGRTVVPIRFIAESLDAKVEWEPLVKNIIITFPKDEVLIEN